MGRAIHFLSKIEENLKQEPPKGSGIWLSGYWDARGAFDPAQLPGAWIILHRPAKAQTSYHGGKIIDVLDEHRPEFARPDRYIIRYAFNPVARNVAWPSTGRHDTNAWCSGLVDWPGAPPL
ncbi:MAG: hypothetical protein ABL932_07940 [Terricaulis sp.]